MACTSNFHSTFNGAIALNNYGIVLLEKQCYEQALSTLKDAAQTIKSLLFPLGGSDEFVLQEQIHEASLRLASPQVSRIHQPPSVRIQNIGGSGTFQQQHDKSRLRNDCLLFPPASLQLASNNCSHISTRDTYAYPMRIDDINSNNQSADGIDLNVAIIMYNYAIANWCFAYVAESPYTTHYEEEHQDKQLSTTTHHQFAIKLLEVSHNLLEQVYSRCQDEYVLRTTASINATVASCMIRFLVSDPASCPYGPVLLPGLCAQLLRRVLELESVTTTLDGIFYYWKGADNVAAAAWNMEDDLDGPERNTLANANTKISPLSTVLVSKTFIHVSSPPVGGGTLLWCKSQKDNLGGSHRCGHAHFLVEWWGKHDGAATPILELTRRTFWKPSRHSPGIEALQYDSRAMIQKYLLRRNYYFYLARENKEKQ